MTKITLVVPLCAVGVSRSNRLVCLFSMFSRPLRKHTHPPHVVHVPKYTKVLILGMVNKSLLATELAKWDSMITLPFCVFDFPNDAWKSIFKTMVYLLLQFFNNQKTFFLKRNHVTTNWNLYNSKISFLLPSKSHHKRALLKGKHFHFSLQFLMSAQIFPIRVQHSKQQQQQFTSELVPLFLTLFPGSFSSKDDRAIKMQEDHTAAFAVCIFKKPEIF